MKIVTRQDICLNCDAVIVPFTKGCSLEADIPELWKAAVLAAMEQKHIIGEVKGIHTVTVFFGGRLLLLVLAGLGDQEKCSNREVYLAFARALKRCREEGVQRTEVLLDNAPELFGYMDRIKKLCELPYQTAYEFNHYKSAKAEPVMAEVAFVTASPGFDAVLSEAAICGESTLTARDLVNHPSMYMTSQKLCQEAVRIGKACSIEVEIFDKEQCRAMKMDSFLAVARGAAEEPNLIVMRYRGAGDGHPVTAMVGKGVMFDSGGYCLKSKMATMHDDMGGAAAVIGAIEAIARAKRKVNVTAVVAACKNMISGDAFVPGDILGSMKGLTIEMLNTDAEGRLTLADAITYAIQMEGADRIIDIATLTGAAKGAVGGRTAAALSNDDRLYETVWKASQTACEKIWRLHLDEELMPVLHSAVADIKNASPGNTMGGGTIVAAMFIRAFTEGKPWVHIDMAPVNWQTEETPYCRRGATGYGVSLLYETAKLLEAEE